MQRTAQTILIDINHDKITGNIIDKIADKIIDPKATLKTQNILSTNKNPKTTSLIHLQSVVLSNVKSRQGPNLLICTPESLSAQYLGTTTMKTAPGRLQLTPLLKLNAALRKTLLSRKFYLEICDKILDSSATVDRNLYFICYFALLVSAVLDNRGHILQFLVKQKENVLRLAGIPQCPNKAVLREQKHPTDGEKRESHEKQEESDVPERTNDSPVVINTKIDVRLGNIAKHLKTTSSYISDVRIFNRLTDAIKYMPWIIDEFSALSGLPLPLSNRIINFAQAINCLILELFENVGWLTEHNWIGTGDNDWWCMETYIWSSRVWGAYIVIEILELFRRTPRAKRDGAWRISVFQQMVQLPLVLHWSLYEGCLSPFWVGLCGSGASWWDFRDLWSSLELE